MNGLITAINLIGGMGLFLYGMNVMSDRVFQRAGGRLKDFLDSLTSNRFAGVATGAAVTGIIQSSSATTVLLVSLVNAGLITLEQSIGVVMGANIGTTLTAWIVSLVGFKFSISTLALPAIAVGLPMYFSKKEKTRELAEILIGFGILFLGLEVMKDSVPDLKSNPQALEFAQHIAKLGPLSVVIFVIFGTLITVIVQSSSVTMAVTITMAYKGWIGFPQAAAMVMGENIGTTITAYIASLGMSVTAKQTARAHTLFNLIGVVWMLAVFPLFLAAIDRLVPGDVANPENLPFHLSAFHTVFNISNTALLIGFVPLLAKGVRGLVRERKPVAGDTDYNLPFVPGNVPESVESNLIIARSEIEKMAEIAYDMLMSVMNITPSTGTDILPVIKEIKNKERLTDDMQMAITHCLTESMVETLSEEQALSIYAAQRIVNELESVGDSCENMADLLKRRAKKQLEFHETGVDELLDYMSLALDFLRYNCDYLSRKIEVYDITHAYEMERSINKQRKRLRKVTEERLTQGTDVRGALVFIDMVKNLEHIGDYSLNISQAIRALEV